MFYSTPFLLSLLLSEEEMIILLLVLPLLLLLIGGFGSFMLGNEAMFQKGVPLSLVDAYNLLS